MSQYYCQLTVKICGISCAAILFIILCACCASAHAPFLEKSDFTEQKPFYIKGSIEKSRAVYAWLEHMSDTDIYSFDLTRQQRVFVRVLVPVCPAYEQFFPWFAVAGPGLPVPEETLPVSLPEGYGAVIVKQSPSALPRRIFHEHFSNKKYYISPSFDQVLSTPGTWYIVYWSPDNATGDYVAVIGFKERFSFTDIGRTFSILPRLWFDRELHTECEE